MNNSLKTVLLLGLLSGILLVIGDAFGGQQGLIAMFGLAVVMNFVSYWFSDKIVLKMYRVSPRRHNCRCRRCT
jgi:heat shock protein HtpX